MLPTAQKRQPVRRLFTFDGTQQCVTELTDTFGTAEVWDHPATNGITSDGLLIGNAGMGFMTLPVGGVLIIEYGLTGSIRIVDNFPNATAANVIWETLS